MTLINQVAIKILRHLSVQSDLTATTPDIGNAILSEMAVSRPTIKNALNRLMDSGQINQSAGIKQGPGRAPYRWTLTQTGLVELIGILEGSAD